MASKNIKGITIEIGGNTTKLQNALKGNDLDEIRTKKEELTHAAQNVAVKAYQQAQQQQNANNGNKNANDDGTIDADYEDVK